MIEQLKKEHEQFRSLLGRLRAPTASLSHQEWVERFHSLLALIHEHIAREEAFYLELRDRHPDLDKAIEDARDTDFDVEDLLWEIEVTDRGFEKPVRELISRLEEHLEEGDLLVFPKLRRMLPAEELSSIAESASGKVSSESRAA